MIDFVETIKHYCSGEGLEYKECVCDAGASSVDSEEVKIIPNGGYRASIFKDGQEIAYGFSPIHDEGLTEENKEGAHRSLLYTLLTHCVNLHS